MKRILLAVCAGALLAGCGSDNGKNGGDEGPNGGDIVAQQAQLVVDDAVAKVERMPEVFPEIPLDQLRAKAAIVKIFVKPQTFAIGVETDAINNGIDTIELNMRRWQRITRYERKLALILHELLGLIGLEKNNYSISSRILPERRFSQDQEYACFVIPTQHKCKVRLVYDMGAKAFAVRDLGCGSFEGYPMTLFRRANGFYSTRSHCPDQDPNGEEGVSKPGEETINCSISSGSGREWDTLHFADGYRFTFSGLERSHLECERVR